MPPSRKPQAYRDYFCKPCNVRFSSHENLMKHKAIKRENSSPDHRHCNFCGKDFATEDAKIRHLQEWHPQEQKLVCPGCGDGPLPRASSLMAHIESGECAHINVDAIEKRREEKLEFPAKLAAMTKQPLKGNYTEYMPTTQAIKYKEEEIWVVPEEKGEPIKFEDGAFPELPGKKGSGSNETPVTSGAVWLPPGAAPFKDWEPTDTSTANDAVWLPQDAEETAKPTAWTKKESLFPGAPDVKRPTEAEVRAVTEPNPKDQPGLEDIDDPDDPQFNLARHFSPYIGKYVCPKLYCIKTFKKSDGLISHLRSPAHGDKTYICPYCYKRFKSLTAITSHTESASVTCKMRNTSGYGAFIDQLTGGIIDVDLNRHDDGTVKYDTSESAREAYGKSKDAQRVPGAEENTAGKKKPGDDDYSFW